VRDVLTESNVEAFTLAAPDAPNLTALSAAMDPDQRVHDFFSAGTGAGIYVHSKAAIFAFLTNGEFRATIGSANLFERSVGAPLRDAEANVFWTSDKVGDFWRDLWKEHGGASVTGVPTLADMKQKFHDLGWENLKALLKGRWPGPSNTRMIRLDVVQRCVRAGLC